MVQHRARLYVLVPVQTPSVLLLDRFVWKWVFWGDGRVQGSGCVHSTSGTFPSFAYLVLREHSQREKKNKKQVSTGREMGRTVKPARDRHAPSLQVDWGANFLLCRLLRASEMCESKRRAAFWLGSVGAECDGKQGGGQVI